LIVLLFILNIKFINHFFICLFLNPSPDEKLLFKFSSIIFSSFLIEQSLLVSRDYDLIDPKMFPSVLIVSIILSSLLFS
jgi:hypothetical protein